MPYDPSELPGEVLALRCYVAALIQVLPSSTRLLLAEAFETRADLVIDQLDESGKAGFVRTATSLAVRRPSHWGEVRGTPRQACIPPPER